MVIRIDALNPTVLPGRDYVLPVMKDGLIVKLTVGQIIDLILGAAPDQLNTLQELAAALGDDENFAATVTAALATKASLSGAETLLNKTLTTPTIKLKQSVLPGASAEGEIEWDTDKDRLVVGDGAGPAIFGQVTPWVHYTPTITGFGTVVAVSFVSRRLGDSLHVRGKFTSGTPTATEARVSLGFNGVDGGLTIDATKNPALQLSGVGAVSAVGSNQIVPLAEPSVGYATFGLSQASTATSLIKLNGAQILSSGQTMSFIGEFPITGW